MDTRQLAAFCAVVERRSFSQAAERLGVTQPAVSLQVRALEKRLGTQLLDRSGRRVEPTEAGCGSTAARSGCSRSRSSSLDEVAATGEGDLAGELMLGASTGPAAVVVPVAPLRVPARRTRMSASRSRSPTRSPSSSASRSASSSSASSARRAATAPFAFEPFFDDEVILVCPPGHASPIGP